MTGGRWSSQTRFAVVVAGLVLVGLGVLTTWQYRSSAGAAALVAGGVLVGLAGMAGGTITLSKDEQETRVAAAGRAQLAGDAEGAYDRFVHVLRTYAPQAVDYHEAANAALYAAAGREGHRLQPMFGYFLGPVAMAGSLVAIDIRAGTGFSLARMQTTYQAMLVGPAAPFQGALVIINAAPGDTVIGAVRQLTIALDRPVAAVGWRIGDTGDDIAEAIEAVIREVQRRRPDVTPDVDEERAPYVEPEPAPVRHHVPAHAERRVPAQIASVADDLDASDSLDSHNSLDAVEDSDGDWPAAGTTWSGSTATGTVRPGPAATSPSPGPVPATGVFRPGTTPAAPADWATATTDTGDDWADTSAGWPHASTQGRATSTTTASTTAAGPTAVGRARAAEPATTPARPQAEQSAAVPPRAEPAAEQSAAAWPQAEPAAAAGWPRGEVRRRPMAQQPVRVYDDSTEWQVATDLHWRGQLQAAEDAYRDIVRTRALALGWDHPDTLTARDQHATVLRDLDRLAEALDECDEVLTARARLFGEDHPDTLTSRSHLATIYHQLGDLARSETEHQRVLEARTRVLGANHQETLISRSNLAKVYQDMGELDRAIDEHHTVMRARTQLLGPEHRDTLMSRSLLASALHHAGRLVEAEAEHRSVLGSRLRLLGPVHLDTGVSRHRLASVLHDLGRLDEAINEYRAAQEVYSQLLGASSPFARAAASDLALAERAARGTRDPSGRSWRS